MQGRNRWILGIALAVVVVGAVGAATWVLEDDGDEPETEELSTAESPVGSSLPAPSTPAAQDAATSDLEELWTPERVVAALNNPAPQPDAAEKGDPEPVGSVPSGNAPGASADAEADPAEASVREPTPKAAAGAQRACAQPPVARAVPRYPFQRSCYRGRLDGYPARTTGKLIFWNDVNSDGKFVLAELYNCTASVAASQNESVIMTAGHCVVEPAARTPDGRPRWFRSIAFIPAYAVQEFYRAAATDEATFTRFARAHMWFGLAISGSDYQVAWSPRGWIQNAWWSHDFAAVVMAPRARGGTRQTIQDFLGAQGWDMTGKSASGSLRVLGFPSAQPFNGRTLYECRSTARLVRGEGDPAPELGAGCDMTQGSSGGPWLGQVSARGFGRIVSVNSNAYKKIPVMYGPRLSNLHIDAMRKAETTQVPSE